MQGLTQTIQTASTIHVRGVEYTLHTQRSGIQSSNTQKAVYYGIQAFSEHLKDQKIRGGNYDISHARKDIYKRDIWHHVSVSRKIRGKVLHSPRIGFRPVHGGQSKAIRSRIQALTSEIRWQRECCRPLASDQHPLIVQSKHRKVRLKEIKVRRLREYKAPKTKDAHVGVEIECIVDRALIVDALSDADVSKFCTIKGDSSIDAPRGDCTGRCTDNCECRYGDGCECCHRYNCGCTFPDPIREQDDDGNDLDEHVNECECTECVDGECARTQACDNHGCQCGCECECECECDCTGQRQGVEIAICAPTDTIAPIVAKVCKVLNANNASVNQSCGLHVHIDIRHRRQGVVFNNLVATQSVLYAMQPASRQSNSYCMPNRSNVLKADANGQRYLGINRLAIGAHKTIEIRLHTGTTNAKKIAHWIDLLTRIAHAKKINKVLQSVYEIDRTIDLPPTLKTYMRERVDAFKKTKRPKATPPMWEPWGA